MFTIYMCAYLIDVYFSFLTHILHIHIYIHIYTKLYKIIVYSPLAY